MKRQLNANYSICKMREYEKAKIRAAYKREQDVVRVIGWISVVGLVVWIFVELMKQVNG